MFFVVTLTGLVLYKQRVRQAVMFKFRRLFRPETTNHTFHYHQFRSPNYS
ncbi:unnamed protein product [Oppiella nova]|uniref:Uncharacterized protein n=1 Tax=Oppiella nova TaxID=334625 RepID=A0A7R9MWW0_9ACAR|nr:unnamed protein product [Oppiella nova]CAG2183848.1 unnamed protein product [Oppiella nova]